MEEIKIAALAKCAGEKYCFLPASKKEARINWIANHDLFVDDDKVLALVTANNRIYFMDAVTGSLYAFGRCLTSNTLQLKDPKRNEGRAIDILMSMKSTWEAT